MTDRRDKYVPKHPAPAGGVPVEGAPMQAWTEEPTGVHTDAQVFRAVKKLGEELQESKRQAAAAHGALKQEVADLAKSVDRRLTAQDMTLNRMAGQLDVLVPMKRSRPDSSEMRDIVAQTVAEHETVTGDKFRRDLILKIVGGGITLVTSGAFLHWWLS